MTAYAVTIDGEQHTVVPGDGGQVNVGTRECRVIPISRQEFAVQVGSRTVRVVAVRTDEGIQMAVNGRAATATVLSSRDAALRAYATRAGASGGSAELRAPMPALVVRVEVAVGETVHKGQGLLILEAMKMENELRAAYDGVVREIHVANGATVEKNQLLMRLEEGSGS